MAMDIDSIFAEAGDFGRQQKKYVLIINLVHLYLAVNVFQYAIVAKNVDFYCVSAIGTELPLNTCPGADAVSSENDGTCSHFCYPHQQVFINDTCSKTDAIKTSKKGLMDPGLVADQESKGMPITQAIISTNTSIISEWNLVCERSWLKPLTMSVFMFSLLLGTATFGSFSDTIGRKPVLIFVTISLIACDAVCSFVQTFELYCLFRGVCGYFLGGNVTVSYVLYYELIGTSRRNLAGFLMQSFYALGIMLVAAMGYTVSGWRHLTLVTALLGIPIALTLFYLPESPRWLVTKARYEQADAVMTQIIQGNGGQYRDSYRQTPPAQSLAEEDDDLPALDLSYKGTGGGGGGGKDDSRRHLAELFRIKETRQMFMSSLLAWFVCGLGYYVLTFASAFGSDKHNFYSSLALSGLVEIPAGGLAMFMMGYSRRVTVSLTLVSWGLVGLISPLSIALPQLRSTFIFYCKSCASAAFCLLFVCTSEVLPTQIRNTGVALASVSARVGCIMAPFFYRINADVPEVSCSFIGIIALIAGLLWVYFIPETVNKALPESIQDVIKLKNETQPVKEVLYNFCCCQGGSPGGSSDQVEVQYSMLNQSDKDVFGKENFDNVNFDYDDFNSSSEDEISAVTGPNKGGNQAKSIA